MLLFYALLQAYAQVGTTYYIHAPNGMRLRKMPETGEVLTAIPYGAAVTMLESPEKIILPTTTVDGIQASWIYVQSGTLRGYLFSGYVSELPAPSKGCNSMLMYLKENFKEMTKAISLPMKGYEDGKYLYLDTLRIFFHAQSRVTVVYREEIRDESSTMEFCQFHGASMREAWLLTQVCYAKEIKDVIAAYTDKENGRENPNIDQLDLNYTKAHYQQLKPSEEFNALLYLGQTH